MGQPSDHLASDYWGTLWRFFLAKRAVDIAAIMLLWHFFASEHQSFDESGYWLILGVLALSAIIWFRDVLAYFVVMLFDGEKKRVPLSILSMLRKSEIDPDDIRPASLDGLRNVMDANYIAAEQRVHAAIIYMAGEGFSKVRPWYQRAYARDLIDNSILRYTLEHRKASNSARDGESEDSYVVT